VEARNLTRFRRDFKDHDQISFPHPLTHLTSRQVLVESFCHGDPILTYLKPSYSTADRQELATIGLEATMKMIFLHDFVHGDLHPGNILVERKPPASKKARLVMHLIDCGLVVEMGERDHVNLVQILGSLIKKDGKEAARLMMDTSRKCLATDMDRTLFMTGIQQICFDDEDNNFLEKVGDYLADICYLACKHKVKLEASFINAALACEIMEGIASALYPEMEVQKIALPMVMKAEVMHNLKRVTLPKFPNFGTS
jgi:aarF domain-containing kinase